jgi:hypothetical protein
MAVVNEIVDVPANAFFGGVTQDLHARPVNESASSIPVDAVDTLIGGLEQLGDLTR